MEGPPHKGFSSINRFKDSKPRICWALEHLYSENSLYTSGLAALKGQNFGLEAERGGLPIIQELNQIETPTMSGIHIWVISAEISKLNLRV